MTMKTLGFLMLTSIVVANAGVFEAKDLRVVGVDSTPVGSYPSYAQYDEYEVDHHDEEDEDNEGNNLYYNLRGNARMSFTKEQQRERKIGASTDDNECGDNSIDDNIDCFDQDDEEDEDDDDCGDNSIDDNIDCFDQDEEDDEDDNECGDNEIDDNIDCFDQDDEDDGDDDGCGDGTEDDDIGCFISSSSCLSPDATTLVETTGKVSIKDVFVGDKVMTASGKYKTVFTISHSHPDQLTSFLSVQTKMNKNPLELTPLHLLFLQGRPSPIPAKDMKIGDVVQTLYHGPQEVTNVTFVARNGFYNPVTTDGTIVVDGIILSTYTSLNGGSYLKIAGRECISFQSLFDMIASPFRAFCTTVSLDFCAQYQVNVVDSMIQFYEFLLQQNSTGQLFLFFASMSLFGLVNVILNHAGVLAILAFVGTIFYCWSIKLSVCQKERKSSEKKRKVRGENQEWHHST